MADAELAQFFSSTYRFSQRPSAYFLSEQKKKQYNNLGKMDQLDLRPIRFRILEIKLSGFLLELFLIRVFDYCFQKFTTGS